MCLKSKGFSTRWNTAEVKIGEDEKVASGLAILRSFVTLASGISVERSVQISSAIGLRREWDVRK